MASTTYSVPLNGTKVAIGPFPFRVRGLTLGNQCAGGNLFAIDDRGRQYEAPAQTATSWQADDSTYLTCYIDAAQTSGALTVVVSDEPPASPIESAQLQELAGTTASIGFQHNDAVVAAAEPTIDFEDAGNGFVWTVVDDVASKRVKVTPPRIVAGTISSAGGVGIGSGFTAVRNSIGDYTVTFTNPFNSQPILSVTAQTGGGADATCILVTSSANSFRVQTTSIGNLADIAFNFIAIGLPN